MTIQKARELLGNYALDLSDEQILKIIEGLNVLLSIGFQLLESNNIDNQSKEGLQC